MSEPTVSEEASVSVQSRPTDHTPSQPSPPHSHEIHSNHSQSDSDHTHSEDEGLLDASATGDEVTQMLRKTVEELELALEVYIHLLINSMEILLAPMYIAFEGTSKYLS